MFAASVIWAIITSSVPPDAEPRQDVQRPVAFGTGMSSYAWSGDEHLCVCIDNGVEVLSVPSWNKNRVITVEGLKISTIATCEGGHFLAVAGEEKRKHVVYIFHLQSGLLISRILLPDQCILADGAKEAKGFVLGLIDGTLVAISSDWKLLKKNTFCTSSEESICSVAMSPDADFYAASLTGKHTVGEPLVALYERATGKECWSYKGLYTASTVRFFKAQFDQNFIFADEKSTLQTFIIRKTANAVDVGQITSVQHKSRIEGLGVPSKEGILCFATDGKLRLESDGKTSILGAWSPSSSYVKCLSMSPLGQYASFIFVDKTAKPSLSIYDTKKNAYVTLHDHK